MKLRTRITLAVTILTASAILLCSGFMVYYSARDRIQMTKTSAQTDLSLRGSNWETAMGNSVTGQDSAEIRRSVARYYAARYGNGETVLMSGEDMIYNTQSVDPTDYLEQRSGTNILTVGGKKLLFVCAVYYTREP